MNQAAETVARHQHGHNEDGKQQPANVDEEMAIDDQPELYRQGSNPDDIPQELRQ
jgi:hypothetical protein